MNPVQTTFCLIGILSTCLSLFVVIVAVGRRAIDARQERKESRRRWIGLSDRLDEQRRRMKETDELLKNILK